MAKELSAPQQQTGTQPVRLPADMNLRKGTRKRMAEARSTMSKYIDLSIFEGTLEQTADPGLLKKLIADGQYSCELVMAEQKYAMDRGIAKPTFADISGTPGQPTQLREWIIATLEDAMVDGDTVVKLKCLLRPNHPSLPNVEAALNGVASHLKTSLGWKAKLPEFKLRGVGLDQGVLPGHVAEFLAKAKALAEEDVKRITAAKAEK